MGLPCEMQGARALLEKLPAILGAEVRVISAPCLGRCEQAPAAMVGQRAVPWASVEKIAQVCGHAMPLSPALSPGPMEDSGLRGLGGAGFPAGRKWRIVREQTAPRVMAVNIDEGEPGTFKDRTYLERDPHRFLRRHAGRRPGGGH
jgi:formate dehydrogenase beta subunit